ncbi:MAG: DNA repair protein RadC [Bacteroidetes bacterium]|jgi:DNA repair protein RadC|nr:DNA repair protein RadC [Bacteroidota bacterium]
MYPERENLSIKHWSENDRPREKLAIKGKAALSDAELLAIVIGSGSRNESAVDLSKRILAKVGNNLNELGKLSLEQLMQFKGIGEAKAISIAAAVELGRRRQITELPTKPKISSSRDVFALLHPLMGDLPHEEFWVIFLNNANKVIRQEQLSKGGLHATVVDARLAFRRALELGASAVILAHNHPSASATPSDADKNLTQKFKQAGEHIDIKVLDHIIIAGNTYCSFSDEGIM